MNATVEQIHYLMNGKTHKDDPNSKHNSRWTNISKRKKNDAHMKVEKQITCNVLTP